MPSWQSLFWRTVSCSHWCLVVECGLRLGASEPPYQIAGKDSSSHQTPFVAQTRVWRFLVPPSRLTSVASPVVLLLHLPIQPQWTVDGLVRSLLLVLHRSCTASLAVVHCFCSFRRPAGLPLARTSSSSTGHLVHPVRCASTAGYAYIAWR